MTREKAIDNAIQIVSALVSNNSTYTLNDRSFERIVEKIVQLADLLEKIN